MRAVSRSRGPFWCPGLAKARRSQSIATEPGDKLTEIAPEDGPKKSTTARRAPARPRSLVEIPYRQKLLLVAALAGTLIVSSSSQTVVATAAQNIVADIGGFELFTWMFAGFSLASAVFVPIIGKLADIYGTRLVIIISLTLFVVASVAGGFVTSMEQMIVARAFQGLAFAGVLGSVWITTATMWSPRDRAKWLGVLSGAFTLAGVTGPILGGVVSDEIGWRWLFWFNLPAGGLSLWLLLRLFPRLDREQREHHFDIAGAVTFGLFATTALFAVSVGGDTFDWDSPVIIGLFVFAALSLALFVRAEFRAVDPVTPLGLFRHRVFAGAMAASLTVTISFVVTTVFIPLLVIGAMAGSATTSAYPLMTQAVGIAIGANIAGQVMSRLGYARELSATGLAVTGAILWILGSQTVDVSLARLALMTFGMGVGISLAFTSFTVPVQNAMPENVLGVVTTSLQFARTFGMAAGSAVLGAIMLAQLGIPDVTDPGPADLIRDPEILVSETRLANVHDDFLADSVLGEEAYLAAVDDSRDGIANALSVVFKVAAVGSGVGVLLAIFTFTGTGTSTGPGARKPEDEPVNLEPG
jgi:MFS family permease